MDKEPVRHHYIPQFILKNFSVNKQNEVCYYDAKTKQIIFTNTSEVFKADNLYRDNINYPDLPTQIEKDFAKYESEMALLINGKFLKDDVVVITKAEDDALKLFLALMYFRSIYTFEHFTKETAKDKSEYYSKWQKDGNYVDLWKRNLSLLVNCRSVLEAAENPNIDAPFKDMLLRHTLSFIGTYFVLCEKRGKQNFVIGDAYPTIVYGQNEQDPWLVLFQYFPISPSRMIIMTAAVIDQYVDNNDMPFDKRILKFPAMDSNNNIFIKVQRIYEKNVENINQEIKRQSRGYIFKND